MATQHRCHPTVKAPLCETSKKPICKQTVGDFNKMKQLFLTSRRIFINDLRPWKRNLHFDFSRERAETKISKSKCFIEVYFRVNYSVIRSAYFDAPITPTD